LKQINTANVARLQTRWAVQMPGDTLLETTPLVIDGVMYTSGMPGDVYALDARSGLEIWKYSRKQKVVNPFESNRFNRGVAVLANRVFFGTLDCALIALDARTGQPLWEVQVANTMDGFSITSPPLAIKDKIIVGWRLSGQRKSAHWETAAPVDAPASGRASFCRRRPGLAD
jgi:glucose dehydrogenase